MIDLKIITIEGIFFSGQVSEIVLPSVNGEIAVLPHHIPLVSVLKEGMITLKTDDGERRIKISGGVVEVREHSVVHVLADHASE